jgi:hypothetical protein
MDEHTPGVDIISSVMDPDGAHAHLKRINEVKRGMTRLNKIPIPAADSHHPAPKLPQFLGIATSTICQYLTEDLDMKCRDLSWMSRPLIAAQEVVGVELAQRMLQAPGKHFQLLSRHC